MPTKQKITGPIYALYQEYLRTVTELKSVISNVEPTLFTKIIDQQTKDPDCRSIETIVTHVVKAGYTYAVYIRKQFNNSIGEPVQPITSTAANAIIELDKMMRYTFDTLSDKWDISDDEVIKNSMKTTWGQTYDFEQLLEHAIVHVLRHRRQIENLTS